ncbi:MAG: orotidine-5'-phosphate decarboxylase [Pseudomonadota bacterium]|nr:orotidine-5'-phosphate decarboxylase [Pseudomonadota bacterium]
MKENPVYCAIDVPEIDAAGQLARQLGGHVGGLKIGKEFFYAHGWAGYKKLAGSGQNIFLDLKLHDIPNTVAAAVRTLVPLAPTYLNVHAAGGAEMMAAAARAADSAADEAKVIQPKMLAVTVLTSLSDADLNDIGVNGTPREQVLRLATLAAKNGMDGVVCSAEEVELLRREMGPNFNLVVPGIRPAGAAKHDQKRVMTPEAAIAAGADILVIGRAISQNPDPGQAAQAIADSLGMGD